MALGTYDDPYGADPGPEPQPAAGGSDPNRKAQIVQGIIIPDFQKLSGRPPNQQEIDEYYDIYERFGGDAFRGKVQERFPAQKGGGGFTWGGSDFGAPPAAFGETYTAGQYTPPQFQEKFQAPTAESLLSDPGYLARLEAGQRGFERSAAAKGSILSGGFVGRTLPRALGELASNEYGNAFKRKYDEYQQRYGQFSDAADREANAFATNETGKLNQYSTRYRSYQDVVAQRRQAERDRMEDELALARLGLGATTAGAA